MLPAPYYQCFAEFHQGLNRASAAQKVSASALKTELEQLQQLFQHQILKLNLDELTLQVEQRVRSLLVEIDKQLRLLNMDVMFLQAARQADTLQQRHDQVQERIDTLKRYCQLLLEPEGKE